MGLLGIRKSAIVSAPVTFSIRSTSFRWSQVGKEGGEERKGGGSVNVLWTHDACIWMYLPCTAGNGGNRRHDKVPQTEGWKLGYINHVYINWIIFQKGEEDKAQLVTRPPPYTHTHTHTYTHTAHVAHLLLLQLVRQVAHEQCVHDLPCIVGISFLCKRGGRGQFGERQSPASTHTNTYTKNITHIHTSSTQAKSLL